MIMFESIDQRTPSDTAVLEARFIHIDRKRQSQEKLDGICIHSPDGQVHLRFYVIVEIVGETEGV